MKEEELFLLSRSNQGSEERVKNHHDLEHERPFHVQPFDLRQFHVLALSGSCVLFLFAQDEEKWSLLSQLMRAQL